MAQNQAAAARERKLELTEKSASQMISGSSAGQQQL